jgi:SnoaL-like domain
MSQNARQNQAPASFRRDGPAYGRDTYERAVRSQDFHLLATAVAADVTLYIPAGPEPIVGREKVLAFFGQLFPFLSQLQYTAQLDNEGARTLIFKASIQGPRTGTIVELEGCDFLQFNERDEIQTLSAMARPIQALELLVRLGIARR